MDLKFSNRIKYGTVALSSNLPVPSIGMYRKCWTWAKFVEFINKYLVSGLDVELVSPGAYGPITAPFYAG